MKIEIDTSKDSHEDIKKAIRMLKSMVGDYSKSNYSSEETPEPTPGAFNMFNDDSPSTYNDDEEPEEKKPKVEVIEY